MPIIKQAKVVHDRVGYESDGSGLHKTQEEIKIVKNASNSLAEIINQSNNEIPPDCKFEMKIDKKYFFVNKLLLLFLLFFKWKMN